LATRKRWLKQRISHSTATQEIKDLLSSIEPELENIRSVNALRRLLGAAGLFEAGVSLEPRNLVSVHDINPTSYVRHEWGWLARLAIATGDQSLAHSLCKLGKELNETANNLTIHRYLSVWLDGLPHDSWPVLVVGPGPIDLDNVPETFATSPAYQVLTPTVNQEDPGTSELDSRLAGVYSNGMTNEWLRSLSEMERQRALSSVGTIHVKRVEPWMKDDSRFRESLPCKELYLYGNPNMVPIMIVDLLLRGSGPIYVTGTTFFFGNQPYRPTRRRILSNSGLETDSFGSSGGMFERCRGISGHDQCINRAVVMNLYRAGIVTGDRAFVQSIEMSSAEYSAALDLTYGIDRR
jgi:hypothetical protein